jgi:cytochrome c oxidase subunit III
MQENNKLRESIRSPSRLARGRVRSRCAPRESFRLSHSAAGRPPGDANGHQRGGGGEGDGRPRRLDAGMHIAVTGTWIALAPLAMIFIALLAADWALRDAANHTALPLPPVLAYDLAWLVLAVVALARARTASRRAAAARRWIAAAFACGILFLIGQAWAWRQLQGGGSGPGTTPQASFFYVLTGTHVVLVAGGLGVLAALMAWPARGWRGTPLEVALHAAGIYWRFVGGVWLVVLAAVRLCS